MNKIIKNILSKTLVLSMAVVTLMLATGKSMAASISHEINDSTTIQWIIDQIRIENSGYASDYVAERLIYLINKDKYKLGSDFGIRVVANSVITDIQTKKDINLAAAECKGYAKYEYFMLFGSFDGNNIDIDNNSEFNSEGLHAGANIRTNAITTVNKNNESITFQHSLVFLTRDKSNTGFYCLDANWSLGLDNVIRLEHWSDSEFDSTFYNGIESITEPKVYPRVGDYSVLTDISYYNSPTESNSAGVIEAGTVLHITNIDAEHINDETRVKYENQLLNRISFRAIMALANAPEGKTVWIVFNEPNALQYSGILTNTEPTVIMSGEESTPNFLQSIGDFFKSLQNGIAGIFRKYVKYVLGAEEEDQDSFTNSSDASTESGTAVNTVIEEPSLKSPGDGSTFTGSVPTLQWSSVTSPSGGQIKYYVETFDCPTPENSGWISDTTWTPSATTAGVYNWHVKAIDMNTGKESGFGNVWQYTLAEYQPPDVPMLESPGNGSAYIGSVPTLKWSSVSSPSGGTVKYYIETFDCPSPQNSGWITGTAWTPSATTAGVYKWHVKAIDVNTGKESGFGNVWQYTITPEYLPPNKPTLSGPSDGSTFTGSVPTLQWSSVPSPSGGQIKYYAEIFDCPLPQNSGWITGTSWTPSAKAAGLYNWHVKAIDVNTGKETGYGSVWQYTIEEYQPDSKPTLISPSSGITIEAGTSTTFSWSNTGASRYKIRFINHSGAGTTDINVNGTSYTFTPNFAGNWTWKVCEFPYTREEGPYSSERSLIVSQSQPQPTGEGSLKPDPISPKTHSISIGPYHTVGLKSNGNVVAAGDNYFGQCDVKNWRDIVAVSAGMSHTVGLRSNGTVVAVGSNDCGECDVDEWSGIVAVDAGFLHTIGLKSDGTVVAVGLSGFGEGEVDNWTNIKAISLGGRHTVGLKVEGTVVAAGNNDNGECNVSKWSNIVAISAGGYHTVGLKSDGTVVAVGYNKYGECDVNDWYDIVSVSAGDFYTIGLKSDGSVVATGYNNFGECDVYKWQDIVAISASESNTAGLKADGTIVAVGFNDCGECDLDGWKLW